MAPSAVYRSLSKEAEYALIELNHGHIKRAFEFPSSFRTVECKGYSGLTFDIFEIKGNYVYENFIELYYKY
jgi:hypothetical protein